MSELGSKISPFDIAIQGGSPERRRRVTHILGIPSAEQDYYPTVEEVRRVRTRFMEQLSSLTGVNLPFDLEEFWLATTRHLERLSRIYELKYDTKNDAEVDSFDLAAQLAQEELLHKYRERVLIDAAFKDALTGNYNSAYLRRVAPRQVSDSIKAGVSVTAAFFDVDNFKNYNDFSQRGHETGDQALIEIGGILRMLTRETDDDIRRSGDEFILIAYGATTENVFQISQRIQNEVRNRQSLNLPMPNNPHTDIPGSLSFGIASNNGRVMSLQQISRQADIAAYHSKAQEGKGGITIFKDGMTKPREIPPRK